MTLDEHHKMIMSIVDANYEREMVTNKTAKERAQEIVDAIMHAVAEREWDHATGFLLEAIEAAKAPLLARIKENDHKAYNIGFLKGVENSKERIAELEELLRVAIGALQDLESDKEAEPALRIWASHLLSGLKPQAKETV